MKLLFCFAVLALKAKTAGKRNRQSQLVLTFPKNMPKTQLWLCGTMATDRQFMSRFDAFIVPSAFNWLVVRPGSQNNEERKAQAKDFVSP